MYDVPAYGYDARLPKFKGKERDTETGNDDFGARYYSNRFGRWLSADWSSVPAPVPYANFTNPQTLNLYSMVSDDLESFADLDGHCWPPGSCLITGPILPPPSVVKDYAIGAAKQFFNDTMATLNFLGSRLPGADQMAHMTGSNLSNPPQASFSNQDQAVGGTLEQIGSVGLLLLGASEEPSVPGEVTPGASPTSSPGFVVTPEGEAIPIPDGATGPTPTRGPGLQYQGGSGGKGMNPRVTGVRIMDETATQPARVIYNNESGQRVNPETGRTVSKSDQSAHIPLKKPKKP